MTYASLFSSLAPSRRAGGTRAATPALYLGAPRRPVWWWNNFAFWYGGTSYYHGPTLRRAHGSPGRVARPTHSERHAAGSRAPVRGLLGRPALGRSRIEFATDLSSWPAIPRLRFLRALRGEGEPVARARRTARAASTRIVRLARRPVVPGVVRHSGTTARLLRLTARRSRPEPRRACFDGAPEPVGRRASTRPSDRRFAFCADHQ